MVTTAKWFPQDRLAQGSPSFACPVCAGPTGVLDSRPLGAGLLGIRRRRRCAICEVRFTTRELVYVAEGEPELEPENADPALLRKRVFEALTELQRRLLEFLPSPEE